MVDPLGEVRSALVGLEALSVVKLVGRELAPPPTACGSQPYCE